MNTPVNQDAPAKEAGNKQPVRRYIVMYDMTEESRVKLVNDNERMKDRTKRSAAQFKARHLSNCMEQVTFTILAPIGVYTISSTDRELLKSLPSKFGSFVRGRVEISVPKQPHES